MLNITIQVSRKIQSVYRSCILLVIFSILSCIHILVMLIVISCTQEGLVNIDEIDPLNRRFSTLPQAELTVQGSQLTIIL